jgi:hypothetical protein
MTITTTTLRAQYNGNGVTTSFSVPFEFLEGSTLKVILTDEDGVDTTQTITTHYTVTGGGTVQPDDGSVVMVTAPATGETLTILRAQPLTQAASYTEQGPFPAKAHEKALDRIDMQVQMVSERVNRAMKLKETSANSDLIFPEPSADEVVGWNAAGTALENKALSDLGAYANVGEAIHAASAKTTPVDADTIPLTDSADSNLMKKVSWANIKATLKTYLDTLYQPLLTTLTSWGAITRAAGFDTFVAAPSSANLRSVLTDEDGTGPALFGGSSYIREKLTGNRTYYVRTDGSDSNTGLVDSAGGAFLTLTKAYTVIRDTLDLAGYTATIKAADGTYTAGLDIRGQLTGAGATPLILEGNTSTPANAILSTTSASGVTVGKGGYIKVRGFKLQTTTSGSGVIAYDGGQIEYDTVDFGACAQYHNIAYNAGRITPSGNYTISGNALGHWHCYQEGVYLVGAYTITLSGTPAFSGAFAACAFGNIGVSASCVFSGSATGKRYLVHKGGLIDVSAQGETFLPGNAAGEVYEQGLYVGSQSMSVVQSVIGTYATNAALSTVVPLDDTIPQNTEGTEIISVNITPRSPYSKLRCTFVGQAAGSVTGIFMVVAIFKNSDADAIHAIPVAAPTNNYPVTLHGIVEYTPSSVAQQTIAVRAGPSGNSMRFNGNTSARFYGGAAKATLLVEEIATAVP